MTLLVNIDIPDLESATRFYCTAFQLSIGRRFDNSGVELLGSSSPIYLLTKDEGTAPAKTTSQSRTYHRHWTPVHLDFVVTDIDAAIERAVAAGAVLEQPISTQKWGKLALLADPFGHGFCFVQFLGKGYDEIAE